MSPARTPLIRQPRYSNPRRHGANRARHWRVPPCHPAPGYVRRMRVVFTHGWPASSPASCTCSPSSSPEVAMRIRSTCSHRSSAAVFLIALGLQSIAGLAVVNEENAQPGDPAVTWVEFVTSSDFMVDVAENWQSEYLQFFLFIPRDDLARAEGLAGVEAARRGGRRLRTRSSARRPARVRRSPEVGTPAAGGCGSTATRCSLTMGTIFLLSWLAQAFAARSSTTRSRHCTATALVRPASTSSRPTSGTAPCRTGSRSSSPWAAWSRCRSSCGGSCESIARRECRTT